MENPANAANRLIWSNQPLGFVAARMPMGMPMGQMPMGQMPMPQMPQNMQMPPMPADMQQASMKMGGPMHSQLNVPMMNNPMANFMGMQQGQGNMTGGGVKPLKKYKLTKDKISAGKDFFF